MLSKEEYTKFMEMKKKEYAGEDYRENELVDKVYDISKPYINKYDKIMDIEKLSGIYSYVLKNKEFNNGLRLAIKDYMEVDYPDAEKYVDPEMKSHLDMYCKERSIQEIYKLVESDEEFGKLSFKQSEQAIEELTGDIRRSSLEEERFFGDWACEISYDILNEKAEEECKKDE